MPFAAEEMRARVLYRDAGLLILDKPYGLPVHYGTKTVEHLEEYLPLLAFDLPEPPRLAHRLDKDTSGCLVLARHVEAAAWAGRQFLAGRVRKSYWALVEGCPSTATGQIDLPLLKVKIPGCSKVVATPEGKPALTDWRVLATDGRRSLLDLEPRTGRMHQLRAHCAYSGHPILGDPIYGAEQPAPLPLHLLARRVALPSSPWGGPATAEAAVPPHMRDAVRAVGGLSE